VPYLVTMATKMIQIVKLEKVKKKTIFHFQYLP
jgi:hypothetical protein